LPPRRRALVLRGRDDVLRGLAARFTAGLRAVEERLAPVDDFARDVVDDFARDVVDDFARVVVDFFAVPRFAVDRFAVERFAVDLRAPVVRGDDEPEPALALPSTVHLPDMTRCAASATASAINDPSFVALAMTLLAAWVAVSAASRPASRIARRALGLALIAAAAAASPAASISLLIAAFASLSTVSEVEPEEPLRADFAIASISLRFRKRHFKACNGSRTMPEAQNADMLKGTAASAAMPFDMVSGRRCGRSSALRACEHPSPTSLLNHETSDHLLSLR
jgi:hypothetical protein